MAETVCVAYPETMCHGYMCPRIPHLVSTYTWRTSPPYVTSNLYYLVLFVLMHMGSLASNSSHRPKQAHNPCVIQCLALIGRGKETWIDDMALIKKSKGCSRVHGQAQLVAAAQRRSLSHAPATGHVRSRHVRCDSNLRRKC